MKAALSLLFFSLTLITHSQNNFPENWEGNWSGQLDWYTGNNNQPKKVEMSLRIHRTDTAWSWQMIYGAAKEDLRPYILFPVDSAHGHWAINEQNGIVLDQFLTADRLTGAFTVGNNTIINSYYMIGDTLIAEFQVLGAKPRASSGHGTEESPTVDSYQVKGFQRARLRKESQ